MRPKTIHIALLVLFTILSCNNVSNDNNDSELPDSWETTKNNASVEVFLNSEYAAPTKIPISVMGWEDGINISRNGLYIYATYIPADFLSFTLSGETVEFIEKYDRGPHFDMDLVTNPVGEDYPWYQSDIIYSSRTSENDPFNPWQTASMKRGVFSEGALTTVFSDDSNIDICAFTSNEVFTAQNNINVIVSTSSNPSGIGSLITTIDDNGTSSINTNFIEDNPHIERIDANNLVLFFDSEDRPGGKGSHDIWYSTSSDNGDSWSLPTPITSINSSDKEHQPHIFYDGADWWIYYSAYHADGKLAIFRARQLSSGDWNSWDTPEIVLGAGNTAGIGEPTLTASGDLYFVVIYENSEGTPYDRYDADPWVALKK